MKPANVTAVRALLMVITLGITATSPSRSSAEELLAWVATPSEKSARAGIDLLQTSIGAHGGKARLETAAGSFAFKGVHYAPLQNLRPDFTRDAHSFEGVVIVAGNDSASYEERITRPGVYTGWHRYLVRDGKAWNLNLRSRQHRPASAPSVRQRIVRMVPHLILLEAMKQASTVRVLDDAVVDGRRQRLLAFNSGSGQLTTVFIDAETRLVTKIEALATLPLIGDKTWEYRFERYRNADGVMFPGRRITRLSGLEVEAVSYEKATWNGVPDRTLLDIPSDFVARDDDALRAAKSQEVVDLAPGVHVVRNMRGTDYSMLFVEFEEFVLVAGAPQSGSEPAIEAIRKQVPGKPIRYVVPTHHHSDHAGGVRAFIAAGATVLTTPETGRFIEAAARESFLLAPDVLSRSRRPARIETVTDKRFVVEDSTQRVEVIDIGPTPHAAEMLVVYLPRHRVLYQGDLLEIDDDDAVTPWTANEVTVSFLDRLSDLGLSVERIVGTEGRMATLDDLRKAVALRDPNQTMPVTSGPR